MIKAILFDRDGTLIHEVPYNGDPARVLQVHGQALVPGSLPSRLSFNSNRQ